MTRSYAARGVDGERLQVLCRCERKTVWVPAEDVRAGRTGKCSPACEFAQPDQIETGGRA